MAGAAPLSRSFYDRPASLVAKDLLGTILLRRLPEGDRAVRIVETEAYVRGDPASHAFRGLTPRNQVMFGPAGHLYVYPIHQVVCANAVARSREAVLLRAGEPIFGISGSSSGPGRLCRTLAISRRLNGADLTHGELEIWPARSPRGPVVRGPRVGIRLAAERPLRFALLGNPYVSAPKPTRPASRRGT